jgi:hypothetical protein
MDHHHFGYITKLPKKTLKTNTNETPKGQSYIKSLSPWLLLVIKSSFVGEQNQSVLCAPKSKPY